MLFCKFKIACKKAYLACFVLFIGLIAGFSAQEEPTVPKAIAAWKNPNIIHQLTIGKVLSKVPMRDFLISKGKQVEFTGKVFWVQLDNGLQAVFKELPVDEMSDAYAEVAAYHASVELDFPYIPPTVIRTIDGLQGSLQLFVNTKMDALAPGVYQQALQEVDPEELANLKVFYFVFGQWDTGAHNILIVEEEAKKHLVAIDNSGIKQKQYVRYGELPFVRTQYSEALQTNDWYGVPFPFDRVQTIQDPTPEKLRTLFGNKLPDSFYQSFKSYQEPLRYIIYKNSLWRQFHAFQEGFVKSYTSIISEKTRQVLERLDSKTLKHIFKEATKAEFVTESYLQAILERRDQVLKNTKVVAKMSG